MHQGGKMQLEQEKNPMTFVIQAAFSSSTAHLDAVSALFFIIFLALHPIQICRHRGFCRVSPQNSFRISGMKKKGRELGKGKEKDVKLIS